MEYDLFYTSFISFNISITLIIMLAACLCWKKKIPKNEFIGMEGMVKLKNPDDIIDIPVTVTSCNEDQNNSINSSTISSAGDYASGDSKRASSNNAPHRSLPDIPVAVTINNDNISDLYATVTEKIHKKPQGRSPTLSIKKEISLSQHSSISQADDVSSPYARVKQSTHNYDEVRTTEHPYAQLNAPCTSTTSVLITPPPPPPPPILQIDNVSLTDQLQQQNQQSLIPGSSRQSVVSANGIDNVQELIPAASAIAGMISASQELPYMTPPLVQQPHFSGDSQDSSKGYTSISVREPLINILAQTKKHPPRLSKHGIDSHYATVSDDSDEMYAAIEDPNNHGDIYTSGSETYAQIQPINNSITVSVEINSTHNIRNDNSEILHLDPNLSNRVNSSNATGNFSIQQQQPQQQQQQQQQQPGHGLRAYDVHSRQASDCSMGNLGSPKPEKRQANSPLPPTPKSNLSSNLTSTTSISSGRNSVASIIEVRENCNNDNIDSNSSCADDSPKKKNSSPSKDIEGMYAKVIKNNKFSNNSSQNSSPILNRKQFSIDNQNVEYNQKDKKRARSNSLNKSNEHKIIENRMSDCGYSHITKTIPVNTEDSVELFPRQFFQSSIEQCQINIEPGYESLPDIPPSLTFNDPGYETLLKPVNSNSCKEEKKQNSDYDPNYEVLQPLRSTYATSTLGDDGYAKVIEKNVKKFDHDDEEQDNIDGYSKLKNRPDNSVPGYSSISELTSDNLQKTMNHDYASISEALKPIKNNNNDNGDVSRGCEKLKSNLNNNDDDKQSEIYSTIVPKKDQPLNLSELKIIL